jgi:class 3 adenylate cyclase
MEKKLMTVGFADLTNFKLLVEREGIEKTVSCLQEAFKIGGDKIINYGGKIRKYIGDTILFTFVYPEQAIEAANEMAGYLHEEGPLTLRFNIGLATGDVYVVKIGHPSFLVEDILGETVNKAAMLVKEAAKSDSGVALCDKTKRILEDR